MTIVYHVTAKDLVAAYRIQNPPFKQLTFLGILVGIVFPVVLVGLGANIILSVLLAAVFLPFLVFLHYSLERKRYAEETIKRMAKKDPALYRLTITDEGLIEAAHSTKKLILWRGVQEVVLQKERYFILCEDKQTLVINIKQITEGAVFPFIEMVESRIGQR
ncbi:MAG TPA: hypothetical protein PKW95_08825 [bacterium]|nr:hypothetical protein [bacterium]